MTITKDTILGDILDAAPQTAPIFLSIGMHCLGCPASRGEGFSSAITRAARISGAIGCDGRSAIPRILSARQCAAGALAMGLCRLRVAHAGLILRF